jgi:hypothetical protein
MESLPRRAWRLRVRPTLADPLTLVVAAIGGGAAWAVGLPVVAAAAVGAGMLGAAGVASVFREPPADDDTSDEVPALRRGTEQAALVQALDGYLDELRRLRAGRLPDTLRSSAIEALVAADGARQVALHVATAVDGLDAAMERASSLSRSVQPSAAVHASLQRMAQRREAVLGRLREAVTGVAEVYTRLLELSATVDIAGLPSGTGPGSVGEVNASLDLLRTAFADLDVQARQARELA